MTVSETSLVGQLQRALLFWMPGVDVRLDGATFERAAEDAFLLTGYPGPLDEPCWGDEILTRALTAEAQRDGAYEECAKIAEAPKFAGLTRVGVFKGPNWTEEAGAAELMNSHARSIASAIRAARLKPDQTP